MTPVAPAIRVDGLVKTYGAKRAVDWLSFEVRQGEIFALLGPNGAGKTTTIEILEGYRRPDAGEVTVLGYDPISQGGRLKPSIGAMLQEGGLYPAITAREALDLFAHFYPHPRDTDELLCLLGLEESAGTRYRRLSGGEKQRLALALALVGRPQLVFLDEPTAGLDPQARRATWEIVSGLREDNVTVLLTTHYLEEAERLADRVAIMDQGKLVALGSPESLVRSDASTVRIRTTSAISPEALGGLPSAREVHQDGGGVYVVETADAPSLLVEITSWLRQEGVLVTELRVGQGSLEDVFLSLTGREFQ